MGAVVDWIAADLKDGVLRGWAMQGSQPVNGLNVAFDTPPDGGRGTLAALEALGRQLGAQDGAGLVVSGLSDVELPGLRDLGPSVPCRPLAPALGASSEGFPFALRVIPGVQQAQPLDQMCGDETRVAGFLARNKDWDGVICLTGEQTRWVHVSADEVVSFQSFLSGALFDCVLGNSFGSEPEDVAVASDVFEQSLGKSLSRPETLASGLARFRAEQSLADKTIDVLQAELAGTIIGAELAATRPYWLGQNVTVIGGTSLSGAYETALKAQGVPVLTADEREMTLAGLIAAQDLTR